MIRPPRTWIAVSAFILAGSAAAAALGQVGTLGRIPAAAIGLHLVLFLSAVGAAATTPRRGPRIPVILLAAAAARLCLLPFDVSDDVNRYIWEGRIQQHGINPYQTAPADPALAPHRDEVWPGINHPDKTAIYPPGAQLLLRGLTAAGIGPAGFKALMALVDWVSVVILLGLLRDTGRPARWAWLYALNPVPLIGFAGEGHIDALGILALLLALRADRRRQPVACALWAAASFHIKYIALILWPFLRCTRSPRGLAALLIAGAAPFALYLPLPPIFDSLGAFTQAMHFNSSLHALLVFATGNRSLAARLGGLAFLAIAALIWWRRPAPIPAAAALFGALWLCAPTVHYWYLGWVAAFAALSPRAPWLLWTATIALTYTAQGAQMHGGGWAEFPLATGLEYLPVYILLATGLPGRRRPAPRRPPVDSISILVPTLNDADALDRFLGDCARLHPAPVDIIVCDGGSRDATAEVATRHGAQLLQTPPGRGAQLAAGAERARGDVLFLAHADMRLDPNLPACLRDVLNRTGAPGGAVAGRFPGRDPVLRLLNTLNRVRVRRLGIAFGDQGIFLRRSVAAALGGLPAQPLMEDIELSLRLSRRGRLAILDGGLHPSPRNWTGSGRLRRITLILFLVGLYLVLRRTPWQSAAARWCYRLYYRRPAS